MTRFLLFMLAAISTALMFPTVVPPLLLLVAAVAVLLVALPGDPAVARWRARRTGVNR
ncbi:MAG: hypothetical protein JWR05_3696 [Mucilaginibacter sp.]|jgi:hypothetical protein|nr:hypothetical protein [Mucilaginibacter sp.]